MNKNYLIDMETVGRIFVLAGFTLLITRFEDILIVSIRDKIIWTIVSIGIGMWILLPYLQIILFGDKK